MAKETDQRVFVALINDSQQVLIAQRSAFVGNPNTWGLPGGHRDEGETVEEGATREVFEEIGVTIDFTKVNYVKCHLDKKRILLVTRMPPADKYTFNIDPQEVQCVNWVSWDQLAFLAITSSETLHKSLVRSFPYLRALAYQDINTALSVVPTSGE